MSTPAESQRPLRIAMVAHAELGGSGTVAAELATGLAARGHDVHMITPRRPFRLEGPGGVTVHEIDFGNFAMWESPPWGLALAGHIARLCRDVGFDVMHAHFAVPYAVATELAMHLLGSGAPPWILTAHGSDVEVLGEAEGYAELLRHVLRRATCITVPSQYLKSEIAARGFTPAVPPVVIPNFVDIERFRPDPGLLPPSAGPVLVHASSFRPVKRVQDVVTIFANVAARLPARLLLLGEGPELAPALERLAALGLSERVCAPGGRADVQRFLQQAHVALLPSERESFGLWALEALASGVPVVGSRIGGLPEVVRHGETGFLLPLGNTAEMSEATLALLTSDERWQSARGRAHQHARSFDPEQSFQAYEAIYRDALRSRPSLPTEMR